MNYRVNDLCIGCGLCTATCPEVFEMTDENVAQAIAEPEDEAIDEIAREAMNSCPVAAIEEDN